MILLAAASNFSGPMAELTARFEAAGGSRITASYGSSGRFFAQIANGAPFQLFFSADQDKPARLEAAGLTVAGSRFTYGVGSLLLWSADARLQRTLEGGNIAEVLRGGDYRHLALANPRLAPYGQAALQTLQNLGLAAATRPRWVLGENIAQTYQFVSSGNAQLGFVALSQVQAQVRAQAGDGGGGWPVPPRLHGPIRQDAVRLLPGRDCRDCIQFMQYLRSPEARRIIHSFGYSVPGL